MKLGLCSVRNKVHITKAARCFLKIVSNNGAQFVGLTPRPIKSKIFLDLFLGKFFKISFFPFWNGKFPAFSTGQVWSNCQVYNCNLLGREWIRTGIRTFGAQIEEKNKNIEARQNITGSYKKKSVVQKSIQVFF